MKVIFTTKQAKQVGFDVLEKVASDELEKTYLGDWKKAVINADVVDERIVYEVIQ